MSPALRFERIACVRGERLLFEGIDLALRAGEMAIVEGPNGAGKSSLLRIAAGLLPPSAGRVRAEGTIAWDSEAAALDEELTLRAALGFWARLDGASDPGIEEAMAALGIDRLGPVPVRLLSAGQRRRAGLARVIAGGTAIWLLDEPGNGLDTRAIELLADAIERHRGRGGIVVAATHQPLGAIASTTLRLGDA